MLVPTAYAGWNAVQVGGDSAAAIHTATAAAAVAG